MSQLKICMITGTYPPARCGVGDYTRALCESLGNLGTEVSVVTSSYLGTIPRDRRPEVLPAVGAWSVLSAARVVRTIVRTRPDIVHFQLPTAEYPRRPLFNLLTPLIRAFKPSVKTVVTFHEIVRRNEPISLRRLLHLLRIWFSVLPAHAVIVVAPDYGETLRAVCPFPWRISIELIPIASTIPVSLLNRCELTAARRRAGVADSSLLLAYFGFISPPKGFDQVLHVLRALHRRQAPAELLVVGEFTERDPYQGRLWAWLREAGLAGAVRATGHVPPEAVSTYLSMADACVLPFREGVHPKSASFLAAVSQGIFTVTTSASKHGFFEDENVYYARIGDVEEMVEAVMRFRGRRVVPGAGRWPSWDTVTQQHVCLYERLLKRHLRGAPVDALDSGRSESRATARVS